MIVLIRMDQPKGKEAIAAAINIVDTIKAIKKASQTTYTLITLYPTTSRKRQTLATITIDLR